MPTNKRMNFAAVSLAFSIAFSAYHIAFGVITRSWWLFTVGIYYVVLSTVRLAVMHTKRSERFILHFTGIMLMILSLPLAGIVLLAFLRDRGTVFHEIFSRDLSIRCGNEPEGSGLLREKAAKKDADEDEKPENLDP